MHLVVENTHKSFKFPDNGLLVVGNSADCTVQINHPKIWGKHFAILQHSYGCILEVYDQPIWVNKQLIYEQTLLDTGDVIAVEDLRFYLTDEQYIPKDSSINHTNFELQKEKNMSSVFGLRNFSASHAGEFIIDDFHHQDGWHVLRKDNELHFIDNKNITRLNGLSIAQAVLSNGDVITHQNYKFKVELPGTSGFSKFSPSHPRNVLLSESFTQDKVANLPAPKTGLFKDNLWWLTLVLGLVILVVLVLNNPVG